ncbi:MAG TPA: YbdK family carboxylate-amine ligase [Thermoleophilaceae bacterium]|nr:YbdK family carboxylate-amine ligase [Thermoleophilaceae bacterium]
MRHAFGERPDFTLGVEEELLLVEGASHELAHSSAELIGAMGLDPRAARHDIYEAQIELSSEPVRDAAAAAAELVRLRAELIAAGGTPMGAGIHPSAGFGDVRVVQQPRYAAQEDYLGGVVARTPDCALHVHVGMPDADAAIRACNGLREHLPLLNALAANSPFWHGADSRLASARFVLRRGFPRVEVPRAFRDFADWESGIAETLAAGELPDYTYLWWDVRPHPNLGTVEVRVMDAQASLRRLAGLAALVHGLAIHEALSPRREWLDREPIEESIFAATSHGLAARLWSDGRLWSVAELARAGVELARATLADLGAEAPLDEIERILREGCGADLQRRAFAAGGMPAVLEMLVAETAGG